MGQVDSKGNSGKSHSSDSAAPELSLPPTHETNKSKPEMLAVQKKKELSDGTKKDQCETRLAKTCLQGCNDDAQEECSTIWCHCKKGWCPDENGVCQFSIE